MANVFISYSRKDRDFIHQLIGAFRAYKISYWIDERIDFGDEWWRTIETEIKNCRYFIIVMTPDAESSRWVQREIHVADHYEKTILPILLRGEPFSMFFGTQFVPLTADGFVDDQFFQLLGGAELAGPAKTAEPHAFDSMHAVTQAMEQLQRPIRGRDDIQILATAGANGNSKIGNLIAETFDKVGRDGAMVVKEGYAVATSVNYVEGMRIDQGYLSPYFVTDHELMKAVLQPANILIHDGGIDSPEHLSPFLEAIVKSGHSLLVIADDVADDVLAMLVTQCRNESLTVCAIRAPGFGDRRRAMLKDIAVLTGGSVISKALERDLKHATVDDLGQAAEIIITKDTTTIVDGAGKPDDIYRRIDEIRAEIEVAKSDYDREKLQERLAALAGGVAVITVGGDTEADIKANKALTESTVAAIQRILR